MQPDGMPAGFLPNLFIQPDGFSVQNVHQHPDPGIRAAVGKYARAVNAAGRFS